MCNRKEDFLIVEFLRELKRVLDKHRVEFWLDCGTLLGALRDGKFIPWDHDIDLSIWEEYIVRLVSSCRELHGKGFKIHLHRNGVTIKKEGWPINIGFYHLTDCKAVTPWKRSYSGNYVIDRFLGWIFWLMVPSHYSKVSVRAVFNVKSLVKIILVKINNMLPSSVRRWLGKIESKWRKETLWVIPSNYFSNLSTIKFYGMEFKVPAETEKYLVYRYGENWQTPKKDYITERDDGAMAPARELYSRELK